MDFSGLNQTNEALNRLGDRIFQIGIEQKRSDDERNNALGLLEFHTWATDQTNATLQKLQAANYTDLWGQDGNQGNKVLDDLQSSFQNRYQDLQGKNPTLAVNMRRVSDGLISEAKQKYSGAFEKKKIDHFLGVYQTFEKQSYDDITSTLDPAVRTDKILQFESGLLDLVRGGVMGEDTAAKERIKFREKVDMGTASRLVRSLNLGTAETAESISAKINDSQLFPYLNEDDKSKLLYNLAVQDEKFRAQKTDQKLTRVNAQLYQQFGGDKSQIISYLSNPENQAANGLTFNEAHHLISTTEAQKNYDDTQANRIKNENRQKAINTFYSLDNQGKVGAALDFMRKAARDGIVEEKDYFDARKMLIETPKEPKDSKTDEATWVRALIGIHEGKITDVVGLLKAGVRGDKFASALDRIDRNEKGEVKGQINYLTSSISKYFVDDKDLDKDQKKLKQDYVRSLDWWMRREKLSPNDPKVGELGDKLAAPIVKEKGILWNTEQPLYQWLGEKKPWVTGQGFKMEGIYNSNVGGGIPDKARVKIDSLLRSQGKVSTPETIKKVWDLYGNKVFGE